MTGSFIEARPFDYPYDGRLDPASTALLVMDLQTVFLSPDGYLAKRGYDPAPLRGILPTVNRVIEAARIAGCLIVHTRQGYRADMADMTPYERWRRKRAGLEGTEILLRSSPGHQIVPEIVVHAGDVVVDKTANGAFTYTDLEHVLRGKNIMHFVSRGRIAAVYPYEASPHAMGLSMRARHRRLPEQRNKTQLFPDEQMSTGRWLRSASGQRRKSGARHEPVTDAAGVPSPCRFRCAPSAIPFSRLPPYAVAGPAYA